jgi:uncharacterized protein (DUF433 family)
MNKRTFTRIFGNTAAVPSLKPQLASGQDRRDIPRYSIPEAAAFIAVPQRTMRSWFRGDHRLFTPTYERGSSIFLSFYDVTEAYVIESLRTHWDFDPRKLRKTVARLREKSRYQRPLLHVLSVIPEFQSLIASVSERGRLIHLDVHHDENLVFDDFVKTMAVRITRDSKGKPVRIFPGLDDDAKNKPVSMDPDVLSGQLVVTGTRIPAAMIMAKHLAGKSAEEIASSYRLDSDLIRKVLQHFEREKS